MTKFKFIPVLAIALEMFFASALHAQNPPMNCTPDGIIEVCTLADTSSTPAAAEAVAPATPAPPVPHVSYKDGQLTITAENVPLSDVLHEVSRATGATLEVPAGSATEPVFANIGPGSVRDVMVKLLNGTKFNYVMTGSQDTSSDLKKIVLTPSDQPTEVAESSAPVSPVRAAALPQAGSGQSPEEKRAAFKAEVENLKAMRIQEAQQRYAEMASKGLLRTRDSGDAGSGTSDATAPSSVAPVSGPAVPEPGSPAPDSAADSSNQ